MALIASVDHDMGPIGIVDMNSIRRLRTAADTDILLVPRSRLVTVGDRSFPVIGPRTWNNLSSSVRSAPSLLSFNRQLKTCVFSRRCTLQFTLT